MTGQATVHIEKLGAFAGKSRREAAVALGICEAYVVLLAKKAGIPLAKNQSRGNAKLEELKQLAAGGFTRQEAARQLGMSFAWVNTMARRHDLKFLRGGLIIDPPMRVKQMAALYKSGRTLQEIGDHYGITRERVRQLISRHCGISALDGGQHKVAIDRRAKFEAKRNTASLKHWGCNFDQYTKLRDMRKPTRAYAAQKQNAKKRGIAWEFNLWQWWSVWQQSGKWDQRGRGQGYMMCRNGDEGPYAIDNVFIATGCENSSDQKRKKSGLPTGVCKNKKYRGYSAARSIQGKLIRLGSFPTPELAHAAYLAAGNAQ
ncbi:sigma factor-like helix-turn-helix DNA-binding protein [Bradyrhizobium sp. LA2.1]|uniref:sigma factor-like helix-turn-helix DNA-binding protein n=1 Tax=Bradyrhizobium sp. LA2.1 TaxID=3156376 RepID=UPI00339327A0